MAGWLNKLFNGSLQGALGQNRPNFAPPDPYSMPSIQADMMRGQRDMQLADAMMGAGYTPNSGGVGALAQIAQAFMGKKLSARADEKISDALAREFEARNRDAAKQAEAAARAEEAEYKRNLERRRGEAMDPVLNPAKNQKKFVNGFWVDPNTGTVEQVPEYLDAQAKVRAAGRTNVTLNANGAPPTGFEKALDKKDAEYYDAQRAAATTAAQTLDRLNIIKGISQNAQTGRVPEALAQAGQYFGTKAGADLQTFNATAQPMFLAMAEQMKGALSDKDREALQQTIPSFGNDPRANAVIIGILEKAAKTQQQNFAAVDEFAQKNRSLRGFAPAQAMAAPDPQMTPAMPAAEELRGMNDAGQVLVLRNGQWVPL